MKTIILAACLFVAFLMQGCSVYVEPMGGYYQRESFWYYKDGHGRENREHGRYHHHPEDEHHDKQGK